MLADLVVETEKGIMGQSGAIKVIKHQEEATPVFAGMRGVMYLVSYSHRSQLYILINMHDFDFEGVIREALFLELSDLSWNIHPNRAGKDLDHDKFAADDLEEMVWLCLENKAWIL